MEDVTRGGPPPHPLVTPLVGGCTAVPTTQTLPWELTALLILHGWFQGKTKEGKERRIIRIVG